VIARVLIVAAVAGVALVVTLAAAGSGTAADDPVRLTVTFSREPGARQVAHLRCAASGARADGFLRAVGARRACATARRVAAFLASRPDANRACTEIFGGPERARVAGTIGGRRVNRAFSRTDGCKIADWRRAMPLLPARADTG
jgi:hypothetical protein